ncbi:MAG: hypothetical protein KAG92_01425 [Deltaproteobacteria bacterium]|nr:hypothetical protein [Deltaproteobacteria bacterium]
MKEPITACIINCTPHPIYVYDEERKIIIKAYRKSLRPVRLEEMNVPQEPIAGIPINKVYYNSCKLPRQRTGIYYIVSSIVQRECKHRTDLLVPSRLVKNAKGFILGCQAFSF